MKKKTLKKIAGQATAEYIVVAVMLVAAFLAPVPGQNGQSAVELLVEAIKEEYRAYKYAHSIGVLPF